MSAFNIAGRLILDTKDYVQGLNEAQGKTSKFTNLMKGGLVAAAGAATAAFTGVALAVTNTINSADDMAKSASKFGVPIEELSRLAYAGELSDVSLEQMGGSLKKLSMNMSEAAAGTKAQAEAFASVGIAVTNTDGTLRSSSDVLSDLADVFAGMPDGTEKTALAMELLGKAGTNMIPMLNGGKEALEGMKAEADTFGQVFTEEMGANAEAFNDNLTRLGGAFGNMAAELTERLLPYLVEFTNWMVENAPAIADRIANFVEFAIKIGEFGAAVYSALEPLIQFHAMISEHLLQAFVDVITTLTEVIPKFAQIGTDIVNGILDGLNSKWESVKAWFAEKADLMPGWMKSALGIASPSKVFAEIGRNVMAGLTVGLDEGFTPVQDNVAGYAKNLSDTFAQGMTANGTMAASIDTTAARQGADALVASIAEGTSTIQDMTQTAFSSMSDAFSQFVETGKVDFNSLAQSMIADLAEIASQNAFNSLFGGAAGGGGGGLLGSLLGGLLGGGAASNPPNAVANAIAGSGGMYYNGGVVGTPTNFMADGRLASMGEKGPEAILPLTRGINGKLGVAASGGGGGGGQTININNTFNVQGSGDPAADGEVMARQFNKMIEAKVIQTVGKLHSGRGGGRYALG